MKKILSFLTALALMLSFCVFAFAKQSGELEFGSDGKFTVLQISDPQDDQYPAYDMVNLIKISIEQTNPDLIVFTGDIVEDRRSGDSGIDGEDGREGVCVYDENGEIVYDKTLENVKATCKAVFKAAEEAGIPFAVAQGNNDHIVGLSSEDWLNIYSEYENCLVKDESNDSDERIDYNLEIKGSNGKTVFNIWLMDTGTEGVSAEQISWYKSESAALKAANGGKAVPSIVFQHIHTADIGNLFEICHMWDEGAKERELKICRLNRQIASGHNSGVLVPGETSEEFSAWKECGDVLGAYFGHKHNEGYTGVWNGIELGFTYGAEFAKSGPYGIRVFTIDENDVENYESVIYTYEGSVTTGNARLEEQKDEPYEVYGNVFEKLIAGVKNSFHFIFKELLRL